MGSEPEWLLKVGSLLSIIEEEKKENDLLCKLILTHV
jgi:hypothetical protein